MPSPLGRDTNHLVTCPKPFEFDPRDPDIFDRLLRIDASGRADEEQDRDRPNSNPTTDNAPMKSAKRVATGETTHALGRPTSIIVRDSIVSRTADAPPSTGSTRILRTGAATRSPLQRRGAGQGDQVCSIGLGDMAAKPARARRSTAIIRPEPETGPADTGHLDGNLLPEVDIRGHIDIDDIDFRHATDVASPKHEQPAATA